MAGGDILELCLQYETSSPHLSRLGDRPTIVREEGSSNEEQREVIADTTCSSEVPLPRGSSSRVKASPKRLSDMEPEDSSRVRS